ncbi:MAG: prephenate dehydratase [Deltaproteobacteria bacterium]|nr:prephenate dehydratase [Deltaproteobacteria bacterium]MBW2218771.1 prephenate dehydratase [Deltaproteobacteria bacterium]
MGKKDKDICSEQSAMKRLKQIRNEIDKIDEKLLDLLNKRAGRCLEVGDLKSKFRETVFKPFREKEVFERLKEANPGILPDKHLHSIYREILSSSRRLQQPQKVVYLGPEGTFSYFAGIEYLGHSTDFVACRDIAEVFQAVSTREAELGIIPLENSLQGSVGQILDMFLMHDIYIQAELFCKISHSLLSSANDLSPAEIVYSHPQALEQCAGWLRIHLPDARVVPAESTAAAANRVVDELNACAIGHERLGEMFRLNVLSRGIEDMPDNWTRFIIIGSKLPEGGNQDKTSILFTLPDKSGALVGVLSLLAQKGINMKKLESRPLRSKKWQYVFFADLECDLSDYRYDELKKDLSKVCRFLRILGSYPAGSYLNGT